MYVFVPLSCKGDNVAHVQILNLHFEIKCYFQLSYIIYFQRQLIMHQM